MDMNDNSYFTDFLVFVRVDYLFVYAFVVFFDRFHHGV